MLGKRNLGDVSNYKIEEELALEKFEPPRKSIRNKRHGNDDGRSQKRATRSS